MLIVLYWEKEFNFHRYSLLLLLWGDVYYRVYWILLLCSLDLCWNGFIVSSCCAHGVCGEVGCIGVSAICELSYVIQIKSQFKCIYLQNCFVKISFHSLEQTQMIYKNDIESTFYKYYICFLMQPKDWCSHVAKTMCSCLQGWQVRPVIGPFMWHQSSIMHGLGWSIHCLVKWGSQQHTGVYWISLHVEENDGKWQSQTACWQILVFRGA